MDDLFGLREIFGQFADFGQELRRPVQNALADAVAQHLSYGLERGATGDHQEEVTDGVGHIVTEKGVGFAVDDCDWSGSGLLDDYRYFVLSHWNPPDWE